MARKMKDSGIEWIGEIPTDFSLYKLKYLLSSPLCYGANESGTLYSDILPRYIRITDISPNGTLKNSGMLSLDESSAQNYMLHEGDILFARSGATVGKSFIYHNYYGRAAYAGYLIKASFNRLVLPEFVYYYTCSSAYEIWKNSIFIQSTIQNIGADRYSNLPISVPNSIDKQLRIVRYLNNFCSKFDAIIYNLQTSIEDYKKLKQAVITQAVTKGVRGKREMKDSGVEWIGKIPREFDPVQLKFFCKLITDGTHFSPTTVENGWPYITAGDVHGIGLDYNSAKRISEEDFQLLVAQGCQPLKGDVLLVKDGATTGRVGFVDSDTPCVILSSVAMLRPADNTDGHYLMYLLASDFLQKQILVSMAGSAMPRTTLTKLTKYIGLFPPLYEQKEISNYLDAKCAEIDKLIAKKEQLVKELESYKKSLIYEVVTGKREV